MFNSPNFICQNSIFQDGAFVYFLSVLTEIAARETLERVMAEALSKSGSTRAAVRAVCLAVSGVNHPTDQQRILDWLRFHIWSLYLVLPLKSSSIALIFVFFNFHWSIYLYTLLDWMLISLIRERSNIYLELVLMLEQICKNCKLFCF